MKSVILGITTVVIIASVGGMAILAVNNKPADTIIAGSNVSIINGIQIIEVQAKGGYSPRKSTAKAGLPTVLRFNTNGTFDCSSSIRIPSLGVEKLLPSTGATDIALNTPSAGILRGSCGMGMYPFEIEFQG